MFPELLDYAFSAVHPMIPVYMPNNTQCVCSFCMHAKPLATPTHLSGPGIYNALLHAGMPLAFPTTNGPLFSCRYLGKPCLQPHQRQKRKKCSYWAHRVQVWQPNSKESSHIPLSHKLRLQN